ncbi:hypothetical protein TSUD_175820 [Trifolium subterraneum]|uniref:non-specific serine/threonine protein kinase n=1 Tax=Trifolium subterraneum TaxID=3900 RepID=A0A2Z6LPI7_TRISU|nr:hypothetical protein TSUD_175820 [Trifolium subterraneum]
MELDHYRVVKAKCPEDTTILKEYIEQDRVYDFLVGLNSDFDQVRVQIFGKEKVPSINEVVAIVRSEESRRGLMLAPPLVESSAMLAGKNSIMIADQKSGGGTYVEQKSEETWCTYCNKPRHIRENCWKLKGKPPNRQWGKKGDLPKKGGQSHMTASTSEAGLERMKQLNQDEIEKVRSFLSRLERPTGTSTLSHSGLSSCSNMFFSPENSTHRYVGIWWKSQSTNIWVANRNQPLNDSNGIITISEDGNLVVLNGQKHVIWSSNVSNIASNTTSQFLDFGNLVLMESTTGNILWQCIQHPSDTLLPGTKLSMSKRTGEKIILRSWKSPYDPSVGSFSASFVESQNIIQVFIWNETKPYWRSGPYNGRVLTRIDTMTATYFKGFEGGDDGNGNIIIYYTIPHGLDFLIYKLNSQVNLDETLWDGEKKELQVTWTSRKSECDVYGICGAFASCSSLSTPICSCLKGFELRNISEWNRSNWTGGCVRTTPLQCERAINKTTTTKKDGFLKLHAVKVPDFAEGLAVTPDICWSLCLENCSCTAYSNGAGIGCMSWTGNLIDIEHLQTGGLDLYFRVAHAELAKLWYSMKSTRITNYKAFRLFYKGGTSEVHTSDDVIGELSQVKLYELLLFDFEKLATATNNFDLSNKLGQGGFGPGKLQDGQEIAIKRLSRASGQGLKEFMNEVVVLCKLQHRNLVRLLGCCVDGDEKMLIDSRLRIIHRDLKASNVLLDKELNPKISDFGMARIFGGTEDHANTTRVVGTYGYMSPEYAMKGLFSEKSDVFSFGVLILEIIICRKNTSFYGNEHALNLLGFVWIHWREDTILSLLEPEIYDHNHHHNILRCIHIGLLCVQELAVNRPTMATVISMLNSEVASLPPPNEPAFILRQDINPPPEENESINKISITEVSGR